MKKKAIAISPADKASLSTALVPAVQGASALDELATAVASFATEYNNLDSSINDLTAELLEQDHKLAKRSDDELLPLVNRMWMHLSQRGDLHALVSRNRAFTSELEQLVDVPTWTQWYAAFSDRITNAPSLRTIQRKLKKLRGNDEPETAVDDVTGEVDKNESCVDDGLHERDELMTGAELLAEHIKQMENVLAGKSIMTDAMRNKRALGLLKDLKCAVEEGILLVAPPVAGQANAAAPPNQPDPSASKLAAETDWKQVLVQLLQVLELSGDRLPLVVLAEKRKIDSLLACKEPGRPESAAFSTTTKRYSKVMKRDPEGNRCWTVVVEGEKKPWGVFEIEAEADDAIADLRSPVVSLTGTDAASKMLPVNVTPISGRMGSHEGAA
jgi:hypothetical protein